MTERLKFEGHLQEKEFAAKRLRLRIEGLRDSVRACLDPFAAILDLKADVAAEQAVELAGLLVDYREIQREIEAIRKALGR